MNFLKLLILSLLLSDACGFKTIREKKNLSEEDKKAARERLYDLHKSYEANVKKLDRPVMKKHRHVPTKEDLYNIDHRPSATMRLLLTEKERNLHSAYLECDLEKYPVLSVGDV